MDVQKLTRVNYPTGAAPSEEFFARLIAFTGRSHRHSDIRRFTRV